jgi:hypothetical protein
MLLALDLQYITGGFVSEYFNSAWKGGGRRLRTGECPLCMLLTFALYKVFYRYIEVILFSMQSFICLPPRRTLLEKKLCISTWIVNKQIAKYLTVRWSRPFFCVIYLVTKKNKYKIKIEEGQEGGPFFTMEIKSENHLLYSTYAYVQTNIGFIIKFSRLLALSPMKEELQGRGSNSVFQMFTTII